jgi:hypothetical protein
MKNLFVCLLLFALVCQVSATAGAKCSGNTLTYYDMFNVLGRYSEGNVKNTLVVLIVGEQMVL